MRKELDYFYVGGHYGGDQESLPNLVMRMGGCAAVTACDLCVYLTKYWNESLCDFDVNDFSKSDYIRLTNVMKPYLHPRLLGVNKTSIFIDGFNRYLADRNANIKLSSLEGNESSEKAKHLIKNQIDSEIPVPILVLYHKNPLFKDYTWHWFIINGYDENDDKMMVKVVSYGEWKWFDFDTLWDTGYYKKGGLIKLKK